MSPSAMARYCGPAALASVLGVTREDAARRILAVRSPSCRKRGWVYAHEIAAVLPGSRTVNLWHERVTLARWLRENPDAEAVVLVSRHFVHVRGGVCVETNGREPRRGRVEIVVHLPTGAEK